MIAPELQTTIQSLFAEDKGILAMDESIPTCDKRFAALGIPQTEETRRAYREMIATTPGLGESIGGAILCDETIRQRTHDGTPFVKALADGGILTGVKVDSGAKPMAGHPGERVTEGLDGLGDRLAEYAKMGARFAKWRAVFSVGERTPSRGCIAANAQALARYAALCQEAYLVPIVEAEVLMDGDHTLDECRETTEKVLHAVFEGIYDQGVRLEGMILKPNMVLPGSACPTQGSADEVADATMACLRRCVPAAVPAVAFLSGGQSGELASARLNAMNVRSTRASRGSWRSRSLARSSGPRWRFGRGWRLTWPRPSRHSTTEPVATKPPVRESTARRWRLENDTTALGRLAVKGQVVHLTDGQGTGSPKESDR